jgi:glycerophosphoryl diester phosphodiesterase
MARYPFLDAPLPIAFAHRGADTAAENSMAAFDSVIRLGYRYLETDARATADGVLLAFHDATLDRVTDRRGRIAEMPYAEVAKARIGGTEPIPLLTDVLHSWPDARLNIDVKAAPAVGPLIDLIRSSGVIDRVCVGSFSDARLAAVRRALGPRLCTSLGPREAIRLRMASYRPGTDGVRPPVAGCAQVPSRVGRVWLTDARLVQAAHRHGLQVHVWTVNDEAEMNRLLDIGVDGIMTDRADLLRAVLLARGQWHGPDAGVDGAAGGSSAG